MRTQLTLPLFMIVTLIGMTLAQGESRVGETPSSQENRAISNTATTGFWASENGLGAPADTQISWFSINCGGSIAGKSDNYGAGTTVAQFVTGVSEARICEGVLIGDADGSGERDIDDVVYLIAYIFSGGPAPTPYAVASGDANCSCAIDIDDVVYLISYIFTGGPAPCDWEDWVVYCGECIPGDVNDDGIYGIEDVAYIQYCLYINPPDCPDFPPCCMDVNADCTIDLDDIVHIGLGYPPQPSPLCLY